MADELISRQAAKDALLGWDYDPSDDDLEFAIDNIPAVDAVPVVRCKNCKHGVWDADEELWRCVVYADWNEEIGDYIGFIEYHEADDFCSYGERREENG